MDVKKQRAGGDEYLNIWREGQVLLAGRDGKDNGAWRDGTVKTTVDDGTGR